MVKRSDCFDRIAVTKQRSSCLGRDGSGRPQCGLGQVVGPRTVWGCFALVTRPKHGVGRTSSLPGRSVRDLPMLAGIAPSCSSAAENVGRSLTLRCGQRCRGCCFRRRAQTSRTLGLSLRTMSPFSPSVSDKSPTGRAWCSGLRGCASTCDVLLLDVVRLCAGVPAWSTVRRDDDEVRVEDGLNVAPVLRSTPNQTIVAERGTDLSRQVHGLSYNAV
ncbi:unnamed protein product [Prunus armeniaca]